jgi:peptide/nickel transport system substrate-binding protein
VRRTHVSNAPQRRASGSQGRSILQGGTLKIRRFGAAVAVAAAGALLFSACSSSSSDDNSSSSGTSGTTASTGGTLTVAEVNQFFSFNSLTANGNVDINAKIGLATTSNFNYIDDKLKLAKDPGFGTYTVVKKDPLTVKYTLNPQDTWSDGTPVSADDMLLTWAVESGWYNDGVTDPKTGKITKGTNYFDYAGSTLGLNDTKFPTISADKKSMTIEYTKPFSDWENAFSMQWMPAAHVIWKKAGLANEDAFIKLLKGMPKGNPAKPVKTNATLEKAASFFNTGFDSKTLPSDPSLYLSDGPYIVSAVDEGKSVTLVKNTKYKGDHTGKLDSIVMRTIGDAQAQIQALQNGEVDVVEPQADADTLEALNGLQGVTVQKGNQLSYDHIDLNFSGVFKDKSVREAFLKTIPRQKILDAIITPLDSSAKVLNSQIFVPQQAGYADSVANNGSSQYGAPDIAGAKALLKGAHPTVKILYNSDNPNRVDAYTLIAQSATQAGFKVVNEGDVKWGERLGDGSYDASIFGWINTGVGVSGVPQIFGTGQASNFNRYSNKSADGLMSTLIQTTDPAKQVSLEQKIDKDIFSDAYGLPLFQAVGVYAVASRVHGIDTYNPNQNEAWWNVWQWSVDN